MTDDRELLELAAKAAGVPTTHWWKEMDTFVYKDETGSIVWWDPLRDDGDALRLAVRLRITLYMDGNLVQTESTAGFHEEPYFSDDYAAVRRAVVRAAASMAKES